MKQISIKDVNLFGKTVLIRVDLNIPMKEGVILDDSRIRAILPTLHYVLEHNAKVILMSHLGRPKGVYNKKYSLEPVALRLSELLGQSVLLAPDCIGEQVRMKIAELSPKRVLLLENLRFHVAEEHPENHLSFSEKLASFADVYVNDAFAVSHRKHSSVYTVPQFFARNAVAGFLMEKEITFLSKLINSPKRPFYAVLGGAKVSSKIGVLKALLSKVDGLLLGGGLGYTFLKAQGVEIGKSLYEESRLEVAKEILRKAEETGVFILLPIDVKVAEECKKNAKSFVIPVAEGIPYYLEGLDIGPLTVNKYISVLQSAQSVFWNGPLGVYEEPPFNEGSFAIAEAINSLKAFSVVGGGDALAVVSLAGTGENLAHISTGGGASLKFIEQGSLPGIDVLSQKK